MPLVLCVFFFLNVVLYSYIIYVFVTFCILFLLLTVFGLLSRSPCFYPFTGFWIFIIMVGMVAVILLGIFVVL